MKKHSLPLTVEYHAKFEHTDKVNSGLETKSFSLEILEVYDNVFLQGNPLTESKYHSSMPVK